MGITFKNLILCGSCAALLGTSGCGDFNWPFHRAHASAATSAEGNSDECADIRGQIRDAQEARREAPTTTTNPDIVNAAQGKADKRIEDLRRRYDDLDCPGDASMRPGRQPPLQPAPGGGSR